MLFYSLLLSFIIFYFSLNSYIFSFLSSNIYYTKSPQYTIEILYTSQDARTELNQVTSKSKSKVAAHYSSRPLKMGPIYICIYKEIRTRDTCRGEIATSVEQLAGRAKRNVEEFSGLVLDPSLDGSNERTDGQTSQTGEREKDRSPDEGPKDPRRW